jgi:hypothetical protein
MQNLPEGVRPLKTGDSRWIAEIFSQFALAMAIGVLSIYAVLVMLFHKFIQPCDDPDRVAAFGRGRDRRAVPVRLQRSRSIR